MVVFIVLEKGKSNVYDEFYLFVFIVVFSSPLTLSKCHWHFFTFRDAGILLLIITALRLTACTVL